MPNEPLTGRYDIRLISTGSGEFPGSMVFWSHGFDTRHTLDFHSVLIRGEGHTIVVNAGFPDDLTDLNKAYKKAMGTTITRDTDESLLSSLARLGVQPEDVTDVILTPLQIYSTSHVPSFTNARVWLSRTGWISFHTEPNHPHDRRDATLPPDVLAYLTGPGWPLVRLVDSDTLIAPGISAWWTGGHHRATMCVDVDLGPSGDGGHRPRISFSDIFFHHLNFESNHPIGMSENIYEVLDAYRRIRASGAIAVPLFDPANKVRFPDGIVCTFAEDSLRPVNRVDNTKESVTNR